MANENECNNIIIFNELLSLPIIISDWDVIAENKRRASVSKATKSSEHTSAGADSNSSINDSDRHCSSDSVVPKHKWSTGFSDYVDDVWSRMTTGAKLKLREACFEVLRRTDGSNETEKMEWQFLDDDARMLD